MDIDPFPGPAGVVGLVAVVLAGGRATRLDGTPKAGLSLDGRTLLDRALDAVAEAGEVVVVGEHEDTPRRVRFAVEEPRYGGPVAALRAGLDALPAPAPDAAARVAVLAVDMPRVTAATVRRLVDAAAPVSDDDGPDASDAPDGAVLVGEDGRRQLAMVLRRTSLLAALPSPADATGMPLHRLLAGLRLVEVPGEGREARDVDTWADLRALGGGGSSSA